METSTVSSEALEQLNRYLRSELSAVDTYAQAISQIEDNPSLAKLLDGCRASHQQRTEWLRSAVLALGGTPAHHTSAKGVLAQWAERGAAVFGLKTAMKALEEGEALGLSGYEDSLAVFPPALREFVEQRLLPEQRHTHATLTQVTSRL